MQPALLELSVVIPFLNEADCIPPLRLALNGAGLPAASEWLLVDDGSTDASVALIQAWAAEDARVRLIRLTRNFGHQAAISAGLDAARGSIIGIMDADLQDDPQHLAQMWREISTGAWDVVYAVRASRPEGPAKRFAYHLFYRLYARLSAIAVPMDSGDFCVMTARAASLVAQMPEKVRFFRGLRSWIGLRQKAFAVDRGTRAGGEPKYHFSMLLRLAVHGLTAFSLRPLHWVAILGFVLSGISILSALFYVLLALLTPVQITAPGFTTLACLTLFLHGVTLLAIGIVGEYVGTVFMEVKHRPSYLVDAPVPPREDQPYFSAEVP